MRVDRVTASPLFPDDGARGKRLIRRTRGITLEVLLFVVVTVLLPLLIGGALAIDLALWLVRRKPWMAVRLAAMLWWFLFGEMQGLLTVLWIATTSRNGSLRRRRLVYGLRIYWAGSHIAGIRVLFGLKFEIEGLELAGPGPILVLIRHASIIDNMLPDTIIGRSHDLGLRYVIKRELEMIPTIDIAGRWVPTVFVRRASADPGRELALIRTLATDLGDDEGLLIYPEGTRHTAEKLKRAQEVIAERDPEIAQLADRLHNLLPPRLGGPLALLEATAGQDVDVVVFGHVGLDGFEYISDIWSGGLVGGTVKVKFWRHRSASVPATERERTEWLYARWQELDDWIGQQQRVVS